MSSTIEGSDERVREDELDLGQEDEAQPNGLEPTQLDDDQTGFDEEEPSAVVAGQDTPETPKHTVTNDAPPPHHQKLTSVALGSPDETASTPDDTPSLHVSIAR